jgi:hypothetical protein
MGLSARLAQGVHAVLFRPGGCVGETRQFKQDPWVFVHFTQTESDFRSFGFHAELGTGAHRTLVARDPEILAVANKRDGLLGRTAGLAPGPAPRKCRRPTSPLHTEAFQLAGSDQFVAWVSAAWATADTLLSRTAGISDKRRNVRFLLLTIFIPLVARW